MSTCPGPFGGFQLVTCRVAATPLHAGVRVAGPRLLRAPADCKKSSGLEKIGADKKSCVQLFCCRRPYLDPATGPRHGRFAASYNLQVSSSCKKKEQAYKIFKIRKVPMGAAQQKQHEEIATKQEKTVFSPTWIDCGSVCQPAKKQLLTSKRKGTLSSSAQGSKMQLNVPTFVRQNSDAGKKSSRVDQNQKRVMEAVKQNPKEEKATNQERSIFSPTCIDCDTACQSAKKPQLTSGTKGAVSSSAQGSKKLATVPSFIWQVSDAGKNSSGVDQEMAIPKSGTDNKQTAKQKIPGAKSIQKPQSAGPEPRNKPTPQPSIQGSTPDGWSKEQLDRLHWAVQVIAKRSKFRTPGANTMQAILAAKAAGKQNPTDYDARQGSCRTSF